LVDDTRKQWKSRKREEYGEGRVEKGKNSETEKQGKKRVGKGAW